MSRYILKTLGCKANLYDTQLIEQELQKRGWMPHSSTSETSGTPGLVEDSPGTQLCIVNSCTVTNEADRQSRKMATRLARDNPQAIVVMTGCGAEVDPESMAQVKGVHYVVGNQNKDRIIDLILEKTQTKQDFDPSLTSDILKQETLGTTKTYKELTSTHPLDREWPAPDSFTFPTSKQEKGQSSTTRSFLKIQDGCNSFCTYCIIPYGRGPTRSLKPEPLIHQIKRLVEQGAKEVILTGINIGDYGKDWGKDKEPALDTLIDRILSETSVERLRVSSLDPTEITPKMIQMMEKDSRFCPHFHVSLQSPHSRILRLMKRPYRFEQVQECLLRLSELSSPSAPIGGAFVGMDVITGFPGETQEEFEWTYEALESLPWTRLHVFPYSERAGTPATKLPNSVPHSKRVDRARKLNHLSFERLKKKYTSVLEECKATGKTLDSILVEGAGNQSLKSGYTPNYLKVMIPVETNSENSFYNKTISASPIDLTLDTAGWDVAFIGTRLSFAYPLTQNQNQPKK